MLRNNSKATFAALLSLLLLSSSAFGQTLGPPLTGGGTGSGTVTSITCNGGLTGGTITTSGTCALDLSNTTTLQVLYNKAGVVTSDSGFTYAGSGGGVGIGQSAATIVPGQLVISPTITAQTASLTLGLAQFGGTYTYSSGNPFEEVSISPTVTGATSVIGLAIAPTAINPTSTTLGINGVTGASSTTAANTSGLKASSQTGRVNNANNQNWTGAINSGLIGSNAGFSIQASATGTISNAAAFLGSATNSGSGASITNGYGFYMVNPTATGAITTFADFYAATPTTATNNVVLGAGTLTTGNWFIYDNSGYNSLLSGSLTVNTIGTGTGDFVCAPIGGGLISQGVTTCVASDKRVKNDLGVVTPEMAVARIMATPQEHRFSYKPGYGASGIHEGWFAQDIQADRDFSETVYKSKATKLTPDGELTFDKGEIGPDTTTAVKWLIGRVRVDEALIKAQQKELAGLAAQRGVR